MIQILRAGGAKGLGMRLHSSHKPGMSRRQLSFP